MEELSDVGKVNAALPYDTLVHVRPYSAICTSWLTDSDALYASSMEQIKNLAHSIGAQHLLLGHILAVGRPHSTDADIVCTLLDGTFGFVDVADRQTNNGIGSDKATSQTDRAVGLTNVNARSTYAGK